MLTLAHAKDALLGMFKIGRSDIDRINQRTFGHLFQGGEGIGNLMLGRKSIGCLLLTGAHGYELKPFILSSSSNHPVGDEIGADHTKTHFLHRQLAYNGC